MNSLYRHVHSYAFHYYTMTYTLMVFLLIDDPSYSRDISVKYVQCIVSVMDASGEYQRLTNEI